MSPKEVRAEGAARPSFQPRALVIDLDGTCIQRGAFLHPRTERAVRAAARRLPTIIATGRQYISALPWAQRMGVSEPLVCYEGAVVRTMPDGAGPLGSVLLERPLGAAPGVDSLHIARRHGWHYHAYDGEQLVAERDRPELQYYCEIAGVDYRLVPDLEPVMRSGSPKAVCVIQDVDVAARCMELMREALGSAAHVTRSLQEYVEIVDPGVSKSHACELVCRRHGVTLKEIVAIGDAPNDVDLLDAAGFAAAVDAGRYPAVLEHADVACAPPTDGGVADVLEAIGLA